MRVLGYHAMRMRWCLAALLAFLRRWGVQLFVAAALAGGASLTADSALATVRGLCAWLVLPLFRAAVEPLWFAPAVLLQAVLGGALVWGMRPLLWPVRWAAAERALPIATRDRMVSDGIVVALALTPLAVLYAIGAQALVAQDPAWLRPAAVRASSGLGIAVLGSLALGVAALQAMRRADLPRSARSGRAMPRTDRRVATRPLLVAGWIHVLFWWPLWRGPARRSGHALCIGLAALCAPSIALLLRPSATPWWLAAHAALALVVVTRLNGLLRLELVVLLRACRPLPLRPASMQRGRALLALAPLAGSSLSLTACMRLGEVRPQVFAGYIVACLASCAIEVTAAQPDPADRSARWLLCIVLMLALASQVMR